MPERIANIFILVEDVAQQNLVRRYLQRCGHSNFRFAPLPAKGSGGSGEKYVRDKYPEQVKACRSAIGKKTAAILIVMVDADTETVRHRQMQLANSLQAATMTPRGDEEPIVILIPKRHVETWIQALLGSHVDEETDYTRAPYLPAMPSKIKAAAATLHGWTRPGAQPDAHSPPSLTALIPEWRKIP